MKGELVDHFVLLPCKIHDIIYHKNGTRYQVVGYHYIAGNRAGSHNGKWYMDLDEPQEDRQKDRNGRYIYNYRANSRTCDFDQMNVKYFHTKEEADAARALAIARERETGKRDPDLAGARDF